MAISYGYWQSLIPSQSVDIQRQSVKVAGKREGIITTPQMT